MENFDGLLLQLLEEEKSLQFTEFSNQTALQIGLILVDLAKARGLSVAIDITRNGHQLFHYAFAGTSPDNDRWIKGKTKIANMVGHSSYYCEMFFKNRGTTVEPDFHLSHLEYLPYGGSFPIIIANTGMIGTITVSGLPSEDDHKLVVEAIKKYLGK